MPVNNIADFQHPDGQLIIDSIPDYIWSIDTNYNITGFNDLFKKSILKAYGFNVEQGVSLIDIDPKAFSKFWKPRFDQVLQGKSIVFEYFPNIEKCFEVKLSPIILDNTVVGITGYSYDISKPKKTELALVETYNIVSNSPLVIFHWGNDRHWNTAFVTQNVEKLLGYDANEFLSGTISFKDLIHPEDSDRLEEEILTYSNSNMDEGLIQEYRVICKDGTIKWVRDFPSVIRDKNNHITHFNGVIQDITYEKKTKEDLISSEQSLKQSQKVANIGTYFYNSQRLTWESSEIHDVIYGIDASYVKNHEGWLNLIHPEDKEEIVEYFKDKNLLKQGNFEKEYRIIRLDNQEVRWIRDKVEIIKNSASGAAKVIGTIQDITDQKEMIIALKESEEKFSKSFYDNPTPMEIIDIETGEGIDVNESFLKMVDYDHDSWKSLNFKKSNLALDQKRFIELLALIEQSGAINNEPIKLIKKSGVVFDTLVSIVKLNYGQGSKLVCSFLDITEINKAKEALIKNETFLVKSQRVAKTGSYITHKDRTWEGSKVLLELLGIDNSYKNNESGWYKLIYPDDVEKATKGFYNAVQLKKNQEVFEYRMINQLTKEVIWVRDIGEVNYDASGEMLGIIGTIQDITKEKVAEIALAESERKFKAVVSDQTEMIIRWESGGILTFVNEAYCEFFKVKQEEIIGTSFFELIDKKETKNDIKQIKRRLNSISPDNPIFTAARSVHMLDGTIIWHEWTNRGFFDKEGKIIDYQSIGRDITEQKHAEEKLIKSELNYRSIFNNVSEAIIIHDAETGAFLDSNLRFEELLGYSNEEIRDMSVGDISTDHRENSNAKAIELIKKAAAGEPQTFEWTAKHKNGELIPVEVSLRKIVLEGIVRVAGSTRDITERKKAEAVLQESFAEVSKLKKQLESENIYLKEQISLVFNFEDIVYSSQEISDVLTQVEQVSITNATVLILGETGTGKELIASAIHNISSRKNKSFIRVNCAAIPSELIESELFGHIKGAFTGAIQNRTGKFELAHGGTLFLDEIGEMPLELQPKLLRAIQEGEIEPIGSSETRKLDVRIVAATNRDLKKETENKRFREDLYFRLNVFPITIPPLRHRTDDIPILIDHFVNKYCSKYGKSIKYISDKTLLQMKSYAWPGNVRELENLVERAVIISNGDHLIFKEFDSSPDKSSIKHLSSKLDVIQRDHINKILNETGWKIGGKNGAAELLDIKPSTLRDRMKKLGIHKSNNE